MNDQTQTQTRATRVAIPPRDLLLYVTPQAMPRALKHEILTQIMASPHAMIRLLLNPDWDSCDSTGIPTRYSLERVDSLPRALVATLAATGRIDPEEWADRRVWRAALGCPKHACKAAPAAAPIQGPWS